MYNTITICRSEQIELVDSYKYFQNFPTLNVYVNTELGTWLWFYKIKCLYDCFGNFLYKSRNIKLDLEYNSSWRFIGEIHMKTKWNHFARAPYVSITGLIFPLDFL